MKPILIKEVHGVIVPKEYYNDLLHHKETLDRIIKEDYVILQQRMSSFLILAKGEKSVLSTIEGMDLVFKEAINELNLIKSKWWYKMFNFLGL